MNPPLCKSVLLICLMSLTLFAKDLSARTWPKILKFDTILGERQWFKVLLHKEGKDFFQRYDSAFFTDSVTCRNLVIPVTLPDTTWTVRIRFDNLGSYLDLRGVDYCTEDTLNFGSFRIYNHCLNDTIFKDIGKYRANDTIGFLLKVLKSKSKIHARKRCVDISNLDSLSVTLNGKVTTLPALTVYDEGEITQFMGCNRRNEQRRMKKKNYKYFCGMYEERFYKYSVQLFVAR